MATLEELENRVETLETQAEAVKADMADIPRLVSMNFDLLRVELRGSERKQERKFEALERHVSAQFDASLRATTELFAKLEKEMIARFEKLEQTA